MKFNPLKPEEIQSSAKYFAPIYYFLKEYHKHSLIGHEKVNQKNNYLFIANHSLATYDIILLVSSLYYEHQMVVRSVVDDLIYYSPFLHSMKFLLGMVPGNYKSLKALLERGESVLIAPGGMRESLRSSEEKRKIIWQKKRGFAALSVTTGTPVMLAACPEADDIYDVAKSPVTEFIYKKFRLPFPIAKGRSKYLPFLPKKVKLTHYLDGPFTPPKYENDADLQKKINEFHEFLSMKMQELLTNPPTTARI